jgi:hypothetical protein
MMEDIAKMEYKDEQGNVTELAYSIKLQKQDLTIKKIGVAILILVAILFGLLLSGGTITRLLHNVVC